MRKLIKHIKFKQYQKYDVSSNILGMISNYEKAFLKYYASKIYSGKGEIVDLGVLFGISTEMLCQGLIENNKPINKENRIIAYDKFLWEDSLNNLFLKENLKHNFKPGDSYKYIFEENLKPYQSHIIVKEDILHDAWCKKNIELLFIDAMKNIATTQFIVKEFYPFLIPKLSFIVYQDFDHYLTPWIHYLIFKYKEYFKLFHDIPYSGSIIFKYTKQIPEEKLIIKIDEFTEDNIDNAFAYSFSIAHKSKHGNIAATHIYSYIMLQKYDIANKLINQYHGKYQSKDFLFVENFFKKISCLNTQ